MKHISPFKFDESKIDFIKMKNPTMLQYGNVDIAGSEYFAEKYPEFVRSIGYDPDILLESPQLLFGRGSIGPHVDNVCGLSALTLLSCWIPKDYECPDHHSNDGYFFIENKHYYLTPGETIIFNDVKEHSWLCNSFWCFVSCAIKE